MRSESKKVLEPKINTARVCPASQMGKWTDKLYITQNEWTNWFGGARSKNEKVEYKKLPFDCCSLSLKSFDDPVCSPNGNIYDMLNIVSYLRRNGIDPVTGEPLDPKDLIKLNMTKNKEGKYICPVSLKPFHENTHIIVIKTTGNVYSKESIDQLKLSTDYLTGEPYTKADMMDLQNPKNLEMQNMIRFHHLKEILQDEDEVTQKKSAAEETIAADTNTLRSKGKVAASLTSTFMTPVTVNEYHANDKESIMFKVIKESGRAIIRTNFGMLTFELECHKVPKTCYNFISLARKGYYDGVKFHRLIPGFVIQGGDPTGEGTGGQSIWGMPFDNEFHQSLSHSTRGILSMANQGKPKTNTSQFFITFAPKKHLDKNHPVFGRLIAGEEVLDAIERVPQKDSRPLQDIVIQDVIIMIDPFEEYRKEQEAKQGNSEKKRLAAATDPTLAVKRAKASTNTASTIGKYMKR